MLLQLRQQPRGARHYRFGVRDGIRQHDARAERWQLITGTLPKLAAPVQVLYNQPLEVTYAGPSPTLVAGVTQVNFRLPTFTGTSEPAFQFIVGGWPSGYFVVLVK